MNKSGIHYIRLKNDPDGMKWINVRDHTCVVPFLGCEIFVPRARRSDGATFARDLGATETGWRKVWADVAGWIMKSPKNSITDGWFGHDELSLTGKLKDDTPVSNACASLCLSLLIWRDGYKIEAFTWFLATLFGCKGACRDNGMFWVKKSRRTEIL